MSLAAWLCPESSVSPVILASETWWLHRWSCKAFAEGIIVRAINTTSVLHSQSIRCTGLVASFAVEARTWYQHGISMVSARKAGPVGKSKSPQGEAGDHIHRTTRGCQVNSPPLLCSHRTPFLGPVLCVVLRAGATLRLHSYWLRMCVEVCHTCALRWWW